MTVQMSNKIEIKLRIIYNSNGCAVLHIGYLFKWDQSKQLYPRLTDAKTAVGVRILIKRKTDSDSDSSDKSDNNRHAKRAITSGSTIKMIFDFETNLFEIYDSDDCLFKQSLMNRKNVIPAVSVPLGIEAEFMGCNFQ